MAIFSRRTLQHIIDDNSFFMTLDQLKSRMVILNRSFDISAIATEWELVVLNAFSKLGKVDYEKKFGGKSEIDVFFQLDKVPKSCFIADITAVTDQGYEQNNPIEEFKKEFYKKIRKSGLQPNSFSLNVEAEKVGGYEKQKVRLKLPRDNKEKQEVNGQVQLFLSYIKNNKLSACKSKISTKHCELLLTYNPKQSFASSRYLSYKVAYNLKTNPIINTLKAKKKQLNNTGFSGSKGIIICDGDCYSLRDTKGTSQRIIKDFLRQNTSVSFIITIVVKRHHATGKLGKPFLDIAIYFNPKAKYPLSGELKEILHQLPEQFPDPVSDVTNTLNYLKSKYKKQGLSEYGRLVVEKDGKIIKIPARSLLQLLAEKIPLDRFLKDHHLVRDQKNPFSNNFFKQNFDQGRLINKIHIELTKFDDELIVFEFGEPDPAISDFNMKIIN